MTKKNKWIFLGIYILCGVLITLVVTFCLVQTNYAPFTTQPFQIIVTASTSSTKTYPSGSKEHNVAFDKYTNAYNNAFKESLMSGIFSGRTSFNSRIEVCSGSNKEPIKSLSGYIVTFTFGEEKTLELNGEVYHPKTDSSKELKYKEVTFAVSENETMKSHTIYFQCIDTKATSGYTYYSQTIMCNFSELYEVIHSYN